LVVAGGNTGQRLLATLLEAWGCRHTEVAAPAEALAVLNAALQRNHPYAAVILDQRPQDADVGDLPCRLRSQEHEHAIPILLVAAAAEVGQRVSRLHDEGFAGWVTKPVKPAQLCENLVAAITRSPIRRTEKKGSRVTWKRLTADQRKQCRILLAEDDDVSQRVAVHILKKMDFQVDAVSDGRQALEALRTNCYDVVLLDLQMPDMDGIEVVAHIRDPGSDVRQHAVAVVALTANAMASDRDRCLQAGMNAHISKPLNVQVLADAIEYCLELRGAHPGPS
jgi:CheY-like chemotaxis protein